VSFLLHVAGPPPPQLFSLSLSFPSATHAHTYRAHDFSKSQDDEHSAVIWEVGPKNTHAQEKQNFLTLKGDCVATSPQFVAAPKMFAVTAASCE